MTEVYCKDCANQMTVHPFGITIMVCRACPTSTDLVTGRSSYMRCDDARDDGQCGPEGKLFVMKEKKWWRFWQ